MINKDESSIFKVKIVKEYRLNESTIHTILSHSSMNKQLKQSASLSSSPQTMRNISNLIIEMEALLSTWIENCIQKRISLSQMTIKQKY